MALKHELRRTSPGVPELHTTILRARHDPLVVRCEGHREDKVLVPLKRLDTPSALGAIGQASGCAELPHLDSLVQ